MMTSKNMFAQFKVACLLLCVLTILTGFLYPVTITFIAQYLFPDKANGSLVINDDKLLGSRLIGQQFTSAKYFSGRPSATSPFPYNGENSGGSNMALTNPIYLQAIRERVTQLQSANPEQHMPIPADLVTASGSGLDPEISPLAAYYQVPRIAKERHISEEEVVNLIKANIKRRDFFLLGEPRVNVLELNLLLDSKWSRDARTTS